MSSLGYVMLVLCLLGLGGYFAATEGVLAAIAGALLPEDLQASGIGMLTTVVSIGNLLSSLAFGALWLTLGLHQAVIVFAAALALAILARGAAAAALAAGARAWVAATPRSSSRSSSSASSAAAPTSRSRRWARARRRPTRGRRRAPCWLAAT